MFGQHVYFDLFYLVSLGLISTFCILAMLVGAFYVVYKIILKK